MVTTEETIPDQNNASIVVIPAHQTSVCCRGVNKALGHPAVYLDLSGDQREVTCYYCGRTFKKASD